MATYTTDALPGGIYCAGVYAGGAVRVDWWVRTDDGEVQRGTFATVIVIGKRLRVLNAPLAITARAARQVGLLGLDGQAAISTLRVAIVGAGGTGSHAAQALAYLGVADIRVFDDDTVEHSNLNRMVTAGHADVGAPKNLVTQRHIRRIDRSITVTPLPALTPNAGLHELVDVDLILGCLDHDGPRDLLNQIAIHTATPYIDIATGVDTSTSPPVVGGRVILVSPEGPCLHCHHELDPAEITRWSKSSEQKELDRRHNYGTGLANASVVHLNGMAVYSAIAELTAWIGGTRAPAQYLDIDLSGYLAMDSRNQGVRVTPRHPIKASPTCFACSNIRRPTQPLVATTGED
jgi:molybdopterin/thiamine biosynthesis adenylyltransferase